MANHSVGLDTVFHALSDPTRRAVIQRLGSGNASVSELAEPFDMALPTFMKHLAVLERSQLIASRKAGRVRTCELNRRNLIAAERWFEEQRQTWQSRYSNLDELIKTLNGEERDN